MKNIFKLVTLTLGMLLPCAFAQSNPYVSSTARIIRVDSIDNNSNPAITPESCSGTLLTADGHVFTSDKLVKKTDSATGVKYLVMFPTYKDGNVYAVHAFIGRSQSRSADNNLLLLKISKDNLPEPVAISTEEVKSTQTILNIGYPDAIANRMNDEERTAINRALKAITYALEHSGKSSIFLTNEEQDSTPLMQYVTPQEAPGAIDRMTSHEGTRTVIQHHSPIDRGSEGSPLLDQASNLLVGITTNVTLGDNNYNNAQNSRTLRACAETFNVVKGLKINSPEVETPEPADPEPVDEDDSQKKLIVYGAVAGLVVLILVVVIVIVTTKGGLKNAIAPAANPAAAPAASAPAAAPAPAPAAIPPTVEAKFELLSELGERYVVTSEMVRHSARLGRRDECELKFSHPTVSGYHAMLCRHNGRAAIVDTKSSGGTKVNGESLKPEQPKTLHKGDVIVLGSCKVRVL